jgi:hypothetical protein
MKPTLVLQPIHNSSADMLKSFAAGKPLSSDQMNFLEQHEHELSSNALDPLLKYYIESEKKRRKHFGNFLLPHEELNLEDIKKLKERIRATLKDKYSHVAVQMSEKQYLQFKKYAELELIYWTGYEFTSGAKFYVGGVMPAIYFQWAEFFGVWKYAMIHEEKRLRYTTMIYFEAMRNRDLNQCVDDYKKHQHNEILFQQKLILENKPIIQEEHRPKVLQPRLTHYYHIDTLDN